MDMDKPKQKRSPKRKSEDCHWTCRYCNKEFEIRQDLRSHLKECDLKPLPNPDRWKCEKCNTAFLTRSKLNEHMVEVHRNDLKLHRRDYGTQRLRTERECQFCHEVLVKSNSAFTSHVSHCKCNPNRKLYKGHQVIEESRKKISEARKRVISEGRALNLYSTKKSHPEVWVTSVIENELKDKDYVYNLQVGIYRLDFAWPKKMRYLEVDGSQHYTEYCIAKDKRRTEQLESLSWTLLRRSWSHILEDKQLFVNELKEFIDNVENQPLEGQYRNKFKESILDRLRLEKSLLDNSEQDSTIVGFHEIDSVVDSIKSDLIHRYPNLFTKDGRYLSTSIEEYVRRRDLILSSGVDMTKFKWKNKVAKVTGLHTRWIDGVVKKFPDDFKDAYMDAHVGKTMKSGVK